MKRKNMVVGMKVVIKASEDPRDYGIAGGQEAIITKLEPLPYSGEYVVAVDVKGHPFWFRAEDIKPAEKLVKAARKPLKVGDKVTERVLIDWPPGTELTVTDVNVDDDNLPYLVEDGEGQDCWFSRSDLRRVKTK
jgi:hypothetical protein